ncbi:MAG: TadE-like protein [Chloroflexota bacterium]
MTPSEHPARPAIDGRRGRRSAVPAIVIRARRAGSPVAGRPDERGQALAEFALILLPLLFILLGIIQMGIIFNTQVTLTNAAREGARAATIYVYTATNANQAGPPSCSIASNYKFTNDKCRASHALYFALNSFGALSKASPQFVTAGTWSSAADANVAVVNSSSTLAYTNGQITVTYNRPANVAVSDSRRGEEVTVRLTYNQDLFIPLIAALLPRDANGRLVQAAEVTMVIN